VVELSAGLSPAALDAIEGLERRVVVADGAALANLVTTNRDRHSPRAQKWRPNFAHTSTTKTTTHSPLAPTFGATLRPNTS
jgi:hypothetical protein